MLDNHIYKNYEVFINKKENYMNEVIHDIFDKDFSQDFLLDELKRVTRESEEKTKLLNSIQNLIYSLQDVLEIEPTDLESALDKLDFTYNYLGMIAALSLKVQER